MKAAAAYIKAFVWSLSVVMLMLSLILLCFLAA